MKVVKWIGIALGVLVGVLIIALVVLNLVASSRINEQYEITVQAVPVSNDPALLERGRYLVEHVSLCTDCHGSDLAGTFFFNDPAVGQIYSANLTAGQGGVGATYQDQDWVRALRHGVGSDGKALFVMPSQNFTRFSDEDLAAVIAYVTSFPAVDQESPQPNLTFMAKVLFALGQFGKFPVEIIDHEVSTPTAPSPGVTAEYGEYLAIVAGCRDCHGEQLNGGVPGPGSAYAPNLTPGGELVGWEETDFINLVRSGTTPNGRQINDEMPWKSYAGMSDEDLKAMWAYLQSLEALPAGE